MFNKIIILLLILPTLISTQPIQLTDTTWKNMLDGQWMVEFYAPWCPACQHFSKIWSDFAIDMSHKKLKVAAVDIEQYPALSGRFRISSLPTIFHVNNGEFRQYEGGRSLNELKNYIEYEDWKKTEPLRSYMAPNGIGMSLIGYIFDLSVIIKDLYTILKDQYGFPAWIIYIMFASGVLGIGISIGFLTVTILEFGQMRVANIYRKISGKKDDDDDPDSDLSSEPRTSAYSSTLKQTALDKQDDDSDSTVDELDTSNISPEQDESEQQANIDQTVRQRRTRK